MLAVALYQVNHSGVPEIVRVNRLRLGPTSVPKLIFLGAVLGRREVGGWRNGLAGLVGVAGRLVAAVTVVLCAVAVVGDRVLVLWVVALFKK